MLKRIKIAFIRAAGWPEGYTVCSGIIEIEELKRDIKEMQKTIEDGDSIISKKQEDDIRKSPPLFKEVAAA